VGDGEGESKGIGQFDLKEVFETASTTAIGTTTIG